MTRYLGELPPPPMPEGWGERFMKNQNAIGKI